MDIKKQKILLTNQDKSCSPNRLIKEYIYHCWSILYTSRTCISAMIARAVINSDRCNQGVVKLPALKSRSWLFWLIVQILRCAKYQKGELWVTWQKAPPAQEFSSRLLKTFTKTFCFFCLSFLKHLLRTKPQGCPAAVVPFVCSLLSWSKKVPCVAQFVCCSVWCLGFSVIMVRFSLSWSSCLRRFLDSRVVLNLAKVFKESGYCVLDEVPFLDFPRWSHGGEFRQIVYPLVFEIGNFEYFYGKGRKQVPRSWLDASGTS